MGRIYGCCCNEVYRFPHIPHYKVGILLLMLAAVFLLFCSFKKIFSFLFRYFFVIYVIICCALYKSLQLLLYTPWLLCMRGWPNDM